MDFYKYILNTKKTFIIAEAGVNHNGKLKLAFKLIDMAIKAGVDAVKFQTFKTEKVISRKAMKAPYQIKNHKKTQSQFEMVKKLELSDNDYISLAKYCADKGIMFISTPTDEQSADLLDYLKVPFFKIGSAEITNFPFLEYVAGKNKPIVLSTGMADMEEVREAVNAVYKTGNKKLILLHCVTDYPVPFKEVNLRAMVTLKDIFKIPVGYSDHTLGINVPISAVTLGAKIIEKHFTLNKRMEGPDHRASLSPWELEQMVDNIRIIEQTFGDGIKRPSACERRNINIVRRSVVAVKNLKKGEVIHKDSVSLKRPGWGIQPKDLNKVIGSFVRSAIKKDDVITWKKIQ